MLTTGSLQAHPRPGSLCFVRSASRLVFAALLFAALPFLGCEDDFSGGGGLPGDSPPRGEGGPSDGPQERTDAPPSDAPLKDVASGQDARD